MEKFEGPHVYVCAYRLSIAYGRFCVLESNELEFMAMTPPPPELRAALHCAPPKLKLFLTIPSLVQLVKP